jgi:hypothetical protein
VNDSNDPYNLRRFVDAQDPCFERVRAELRAGRKTGHWMWFIFPQIKGLGYSPLALEYAISSREEAEAYLRHPILGPREGLLYRGGVVSSSFLTDGLIPTINAYRLARLSLLSEVDSMAAT